MEGYREVTSSLDVPSNTGIDGFLRTLRVVLRRPRVQRVTITAKGRVEYVRYVRDDEPNETVGVEFDDLQPYHIVRNAELREFMPDEGLPASTVVGLMFEKVASERLHPIAFVTGASPALWEWYQFTTGHAAVVRTQFFGLPVLTDRQIPDTVLIMCAGFGRDAALIDTQVSYKVEMPRYALPPADVQVIA